MNFDGQYSALNQYEPAVQVAAKQYSVPADLLSALIWTESGGRLTGPGGGVIQGSPIAKLGGQTAKGILQFIPSTAKAYGVDVNDPVSSIRGAAHYLSDLYKRTGTWQDSVAAYKGNVKSQKAQGYATQTIALAKTFKDAGAATRSPNGGDQGAGSGDGGKDAKKDPPEDPWLSALKTALWGVVGSIPGAQPLAALGASQSVRSIKAGGGAVSPLDVAGKASEGVTGKLDAVWAWLGEKGLVVATAALAVGLGVFGIRAAIK